jgi:hypothetical protein
MHHVMLLTAAGADPDLVGPDSYLDPNLHTRLFINLVSFTVLYTKSTIISFITRYSRD